MKRIRNLTMLALLCSLACGLSVLPASAAFDNVTASPRARAMGDAGVAVTDGAFAPTMNPAALSGIDRMMVATSYVQPFSLDFTEQLYLGGVMPLKGKFGGIGFGLRTFAVEWDDVDLQKETTFTLAHGLRLYEDIHSTVDVGYSLNFYREEFGLSFGGSTFDTEVGGFVYDDDAIDPGDDMVVGVDLAMMVRLRERTHFGVVARNINNPQIGIDNEYLGQRIDAGIAYMPYDGVITTFEFENRIDGELQYHGGMEMALIEGLELRFGVLTNPSALSGGFSYSYAGATLGYGFSTGGGVLDSSHQFGLSFMWGGEAQ